MPNLPFTAKPRRPRRWRWLWLLLAPPLAVSAWALYLLGTDNFHAIIPGEAYRAGQMNSNNLVHCLQRYGIRTVVNLRGEHPDKQWYRDEVGATASQHAQHRSIALSSQKLVSAEIWHELASLLRAAPKPVLIHCSGGADRTAFVAALYEAEIAQRPAHARQEFSLWYGYWPFVWKDKARLRDSFETHIGRVSPPGRASYGTND